MGSNAIVEVQNYPGFSSIRGFDLVRRVEEQARAYGAEIVYDDVVLCAIWIGM